MVQRPIGKRRQASLVLAGLALVAGLAACSNGSEAGTLDPQSSTGTRVDVGDLRIRNAVIVASEGGGLIVSMTVVNVGDTEDAITDLGVTGDGEPVEADLSPRSITLAPGTATVVPGETRPRIEVDLDLQAGRFAPVTVQFENAGLVELSLQVVTDGSPHGGSSGSATGGETT